MNPLKYDTALCRDCQPFFTIIHKIPQHGKQRRPAVFPDALKHHVRTDRHRLKEQRHKLDTARNPADRHDLWIILKYRHKLCREKHPDDRNRAEQHFSRCECEIEALPDPSVFFCGRVADIKNHQLLLTFPYWENGKKKREALNLPAFRSSFPNETRGIRTPDNLIKSQVLYQLS